MQPVFLFSWSPPLIILLAGGGLFLLASVIMGLAVFLDLAVKHNRRTVDRLTTDFLADVGYTIPADLPASLRINSREDGHDIPLLIRKPPGGDQGIAILVHGYGLTKESCLPLSEFYLQQGWRVILYDQRQVGKNSAQYNTMGYLECHDFLDVVRYVRDRVGPDRLLIGHGVSMGAATLGLAAASPDIRLVDGLILDCPYDTLRAAIRIQLKSRRLPFPKPWIIACGSLANRSILGFGYGQVDVAAAMAAVPVPTLLITSREDQVCPWQMSQRIHDRIRQPDKTLLILEHGRHAQLLFDAPEPYQAGIRHFLNARKTGAIGRPTTL